MLESASKVSALIFDKTGTLTEGTLAVAKIATWAPHVDAATVLWYGASAERGSEHPIGRALGACAAERELSLVEPDVFMAEAGHGATCTVRQAGSPCV